MIEKSKKVNKISILYWFLVLYVMAALIWWFIALSKQNAQMAEMKISRLQINDREYVIHANSIFKEKERKNTQYIGEGLIFLLIISIGAIFIYKAVKNQLKTSIQQHNFMIAITHELKTPIATTKLNLETLIKRKLENAQQEKLMTNTLHEANRMNALCNNLLLSSQIEAGGYAFTKERINFSELVKNCVADFSSRFHEKNIDVHSSANVFVLGDFFLLEIAINNLIDNAHKYSAKDSTITVDVNLDRHYCVLTIADEGNGIPDEEKNKIFEKYYRAGSEATQKSKGTGLGLYLVQRIMTLHKSNIYVKNNYPKGSRFIIEIEKVT